MLIGHGGLAPCGGPVGTRRADSSTAPRHLDADASILTAFRTWDGTGLVCCVSCWLPPSEVVAVDRCWRTGEETERREPARGAMDDRVIRSPLLPGGDLIAATLDREVMGLADRGGASNLVGDRWADLAAAQAARWVGQDRPVPDGEREPLRVTRVLRLDATPAVAAAASKRGLQNPDLLLIGTRAGMPTVQAADAKFSVETARAKQVSPAVVASLLGLRDLLPDLLGDLGPVPALVPGVFLSPDFPLTHLMLRRRQGIVRTTARPEEVILLPAPAGAFFRALAGASVMRPLAAVDDLPVQTDESLLAGLYYFRLARAAISCWLDATKPLLLYDDRLAVDEPAVRAEAESRAATARSAFELILRWNADVQTVRSARAAVDQVAALPLLGRDLRALIARLAAEAGAEPPSVNQVRRRLGVWYRGRLRERVGPLAPPVPDLPRALAELGRIGAALTPQVETEAVRIVRELIEDRSAAQDAAEASDWVVAGDAG